MNYLVTGGCGFLGSNISKALLDEGHNVIIFDSLCRFGSSNNLEWLSSLGEFEFVHGDIRNANDVERVIKTHKPDVIYHLAGQVAMTTSIANPRLDFEVNLGGSFNLLNAVRLYSPESIVVYSSTNKVYGDLEQFKYIESASRYECVDKPSGFDESVTLDFHSPYGTSKGGADQYMLDFARIYGIKTVVFRHSSMYGGRQYSTVDQGWVGWFIQQAVDVKNKLDKPPFTISGNGKQVRDLLYASDCVALYLNIIKNIDDVKGKAFNIGGGIDNSCSILELFAMLETKLDINLTYEQLPPRASDQRFFVADFNKVSQVTNWLPLIGREKGVEKMIDWVNNI